MSRMLDKDTEPVGEDIIRFIKTKPAISSWKQLQEYLTTHYDLHAPELQFGGQKYGWCIRYRRGGKTLCTLYPEKGGFTILIVYGKKEVEMFIERQSEISDQLVTLFHETKQFHDGKWLWIQVSDSKLLGDLRIVLAIKRRTRI
ncbi:MAG: DUF3788 domain-containing protein [Candidatus Thorarchaeota archaeon]|nr:MAG: DUF3788 domain-containing protein [Candidatus Thorarchaeota archaeon]